MKTVTETRYVGDDGRQYETPEAAANGTYEAFRKRFCDWFQYRSYGDKSFMHLSGTPDEVDAELDRCFAELRTLRAHNHRRRLHKPR